MSYYSRPFPLDGNESGWMANAGSLINSHKLIAGNGISIHQSPNGVQVSAISTRQINYLTNKGYYDFNNEYWPGDVIFVDPTKTYKDQNGAQISTIAPGGFVCVTYVPPGSNDSNYFLSTVVPALTSNGGQATDIIANSFRWYQQNIYYPNANPIVAVTTHAQSGYNVYASQSFWQPIGGASQPLTWVYYDESASYSPGTLVKVSPSKHYSIDFFTTQSGNFPPLSAGLFLVVNTVPAMPATGSRPTGNLYYPFFPTWDDSATVTVSGSTYNQIFFRDVAPLTPMTICSPSGETVTAFVDFETSGSNYGGFTLPYTGP